MGATGDPPFPATLRPPSKTGRAVLAALTMALPVFSGGFGNIFYLPGQKFLPFLCRGPSSAEERENFPTFPPQRKGRKIPFPPAVQVRFLPCSSGANEVIIPILCRVMSRSPTHALGGMGRGAFRAFLPIPPRAWVGLLLITLHNMGMGLHDPRRGRVKVCRHVKSG